MTISEEFAADALEMLEEDGVPVSIQAKGSGGLTPSGDRLAPPAPRVGTGLIFPNRGLVVLDGQQKASERVIMTPVDPAPVPGETVLINGRRLVVADDGARTYAPQGLPIIHDLLVAT